MSRLLLLAGLAAIQDLPETLLVTERGGRPIFAPAFHGRWAPTRAGCDSIEVISITADRFDGYESTAVLLISSGMIHHSDPAGHPAYTTMNLVAQSGEGEVGTTRLRISRVGDRLFTSNADAVSEDGHWRYGNVRCPAG